MSFRPTTTFLIALLSAGGSFSQPHPKAGTPSALTKCATRQTSAAAVRNSLASDANRVFLGTADGILTGFGAPNLEIVWRAELGGEFSSGMLVAETGVVTVTNSTMENGSGSSTIRLLRADSGITVWSTKLQYSEKFFLGRINGGIAAISQEGLVTLLELSNGGILSQAGPFGKLSAKPAFSPISLALSTQNNDLIVLAAATGSLVSRQTTSAKVTSLTFLANENIAAGDERGNVILFGERRNKSIWRFKSGGAITFVSEAKDGILVTSLDNFVYLISDYNGDVVWKKRLSSRLVEGGTLIGEQFVVLIYGENSIYMLDLGSGKLSDMQPPSNIDIINRYPVAVGETMMAVTAEDGISIYSLNGCVGK